MYAKNQVSVFATFWFIHFKAINLASAPFIKEKVSVFNIYKDLMFVLFPQVRRSGSQLA